MLRCKFGSNKSCNGKSAILAIVLANSCTVVALLSMTWLSLDRDGLLI